MYKIRKAKLEDASIINKLINNTIFAVNSKDYTKKQINARIKNRTAKLKDRIKTNSRAMFIILENFKILGLVSLTLEKKEITMLYVKQNYIGKGLGKKLLKYAEKHAKKLGLDYLNLESTLTAFEFYKSQGYRKIRKVNHISNGVNIPCIKMRKILN
jgi:N-acetylglutamate synthase-like GNAT family acetyltransferase